MKLAVDRLLRVCTVAGVAAVTALAAVLAGSITPTDTPTVEAGGPPELSLDLDISGGACVDIDSTLTVNPGDSITAAVCLVNNPSGIALSAFQYRVDYNDTIILAPEVADAGTALDDNPDANVGATTFTTGTYPNNLGGGWDCSGGVGAYPVGDVDGVVNGTGRAFSGACGSIVGPNTLLVGPLGVITFNATGEGQTDLDFFQTSVTDDSPAEVGSCNPTVDTAMTCNGATVTVELPQGQPTSTVTNTPTQTRTATSTSTPCVNQQGTPCPTNTSSPRTATFTPTVTGSATGVPAEGTPPAGGTPVPGQPTATRPGGGPGTGSIAPPDTGTGTESDASALWAQLIGVAGIAAAASGVLIGRKRLSTLFSGRISRRR
jgi:hypothetical protein